MIRRALTFVPQWHGAIEGWAVKHSAKNAWRVSPLHGPDDLMQDAYCYFLMVSQRYPMVSTPEHFMSLFKVCFSNHVTDLATARSARREVPISGSEERNGYQDAIGACPDTTSTTDFLLSLADAPPIVRAAAVGILEGNHERRFIRRKDGSRETVDEFLCRVSGLATSAPLSSMLVSHLGGE